MRCMISPFQYHIMYYTLPEAWREGGMWENCCHSRILYSIFLFHPVNPLQIFCSVCSQPFGNGDDQSVHQCGRRSHGVIFFFLAPVYVEVDVGLFFPGSEKATCKADGFVSGRFAAIEDNPPFPGYFGEAEKEDHIVLSCLGESFHHFRSAGGNLCNRQSQTAQTKVKELSHGRRGAF